jgi:phosphatidate phosphatase APP1
MKSTRTGALILAAACLAVLPVAAAGPPVSDLKQDEVVVFYPSYLTRDAGNGGWRGEIRGKVHEPRDGAAAAVMRAALRKLLGIGGELTAEEAQRFEERAGEFLVDNQRGKTVVVRLGDRTFASERSEADGKFRVEVRLARGKAGELLPFTVRLDADDRREFGGSLRLVGGAGLSVISDIDDTVKESNVLERDELLANAFVRPYRPVEGMPERYAAWAGQGVVVHYVTAGPWQLYPPLWEFLEEHGLPGVEIEMRELRVKDRTVLSFFQDSQPYKIERIREILRRFPARRFVLVGDSGEHDPEVYGAIAAEFPHRVRGIFIRAVRAEHLDRERYRAWFEAIEDSRWIVFGAAEALPENLVAWAGDGAD